MYKIFCLDEHFNDVSDVSFSFSEEIVSEYIKKIDITFVKTRRCLTVEDIVGIYNF